MPFYEYECEACKYYAEVMQKISDAPLTRCPSCGKRALKKLVSVPVFRLKGSGWYETDFKSDTENRRHGAEKEEAKAESKTEAKEAKPAAAETKESKEAKAAPAKPSAGAAAGAGASRGPTTPARSTATRRPARAASRGRARKRRR